MAKLKATLVLIGILIGIALIVVGNVLTKGALVGLAGIAIIITLAVLGCIYGWRELHRYFKEKS